MFSVSLKLFIFLPLLLFLDILTYDVLIFPPLIYPVFILSLFLTAPSLSPCIISHCHLMLFSLGSRCFSFSYYFNIWFLCHLPEVYFIFLSHFSEFYLFIFCCYLFVYFTSYFSSFLILLIFILWPLIFSFLKKSILSFLFSPLHFSFCLGLSLHFPKGLGSLHFPMLLIISQSFSSKLLCSLQTDFISSSV